MDLSLLFAGTAGSVPSARRSLPALLLRRGGERVLFDCGEGTQRQLLRLGGLPDVTHIFITHFHADHWLGLPGMLKTFELRDRDRPLTVLGPPGLRDLMRRMDFVIGKLGYPLDVRELEPGETVRWDDWYVAPFPVDHRGANCFGYAIVEDARPGRFDAELAARLGVAPGPDFGRLQAGETVGGVRPDQVIGEDRAGRKIVLSGDTRPCDALRVAAHEADVLVHEATFTDELADRAATMRHSTARQAAQIALDAQVKMLVLTHLSSRYAGAEVAEEAREVFAATEVPRDGDSVEIPLPERGDPVLVRPQRRDPRPVAAS
ncbi:MAG: ribonuclease Z [Solirubrobacteraceae bacterium]